MQLSRKKVVISEQAIQVLGDPVPTQPQNSRVDPLFTGLVTTICDPSPILAFLPSVSLTFQEQLILSVHKDGGINHFEIKGDLHFMVNDDSCLYPRMQLDVIRMENVQYKVRFLHLAYSSDLTNLHRPILILTRNSLSIMSCKLKINKSHSP